MKLLVYCILLFLATTNFRCSYTNIYSSIKNFKINNSLNEYNKELLKEGNSFVMNQIKHLKNETDSFLIHPNHITFKEELFNYLKEYNGYDFYRGRQNPEILHPMILNSKNEAIVFIVFRTLDNSNEDLDYVHFISAMFQNNSWKFGLKKGYCFSFSYTAENSSRLDNEKITEYTIRNLMLQGYFKTCKDDKSIFKSSLYIFK